MRGIFVTSISLFLYACSSIDVKRTTPLEFQSLFFAKVDSREATILEPNESKSGRVLVGLISAGLIGAVATANTEEGFSEPKAYEYRLLVQGDEYKYLISRSIVSEGKCVEVISSGESNPAILRTVTESNCDGQL